MKKINRKKIIKGINLIPIIGKNFFLIVFHETKKGVKKIFSRKFLKKLYTEKNITVLVSVLAVAAIAGGVVFLVHRHSESQKKVYEALVMTRDQVRSDPVEDARASLKAGDVIGIFPAGHNWSATEKQSYLILKLKLSDKEAQELVQPQTQPIKNPQTPKTPQGQSDAGNAGPPADAKAMAGKQTETVRARAFRLKIETLQFDLNAVWQKQPYPDKIFEDSLIQKK